MKGTCCISATIAANYYVVLAASSSYMALTAHIGPSPPITRFLNLTLIDNW
jgi:hypothetical protein